MILHGKNKFTEWRFAKESDLEDGIQQVRPELFGPSPIYLEIKKKIGKKGVQVNIAYIMETFPIGKRNDNAHTEQKDADGKINREGTYLTKDHILEIYDQMRQARREGREWQSPLNPPPGPPTDEDGNFLPFETWKNDRPSHIHPPRGVLNA